VVAESSLSLRRDEAKIEIGAFLKRKEEKCLLWRSV